MKIPKSVNHLGEQLKLTWWQRWKLHRQVKKTAKMLAFLLHEMEKEKDNVQKLSKLERMRDEETTEISGGNDG